MHHGEFRDLRVVRLYDLAYPWSRDDDFFVSVLADEPARDVLDLGCGTGRLAIALSRRGYRVTGVDPAGPSLDVARGKPGADRVTWIEASTDVLPAGAGEFLVVARRR
jgi:2-polyprenyl-3-methyl-5-hydroxy-6-metoxy-1,4-benzoquinol methylase